MGPSETGSHTGEVYTSGIRPGSEDEPGQEDVVRLITSHRSHSSSERVRLTKREGILSINTEKLIRHEAGG